jgi:hypothetical protein
MPKVDPIIVSGRNSSSVQVPGHFQVVHSPDQIDNTKAYEFKNEAAEIESIEIFLESGERMSCWPKEGKCEIRINFAEEMDPAGPAGA